MFSFLKSLKVQLLLPISSLFVIVAFASAILIINLQHQAQRFEEQSLLNSKVNKAIIGFNELRTSAKTEILTYIFTENRNFLDSINKIEARRKSKEQSLFQFLNEQPLFKKEILKIRKSYISTQALRNAIVEDVRNNNRAKALERFSFYSTLYEINTAQLIDIRNQLDTKISENLIDTKDFFKWVILIIALIIIFTSIIIVSSFSFYRKNLIDPIRQLKKGLKKINRGVFPKIATHNSVSSEIDEIFENFNTTSTTLKKVEVELLEANKEALSLAKIKSDFLSNMSHEIRTPLNSILGMSELLADFDHDKVVSKYISVIDNNGKLLLNIVNDILDLSKLESGNIQLKETPCDLRLLVNRLELSLEHTFIEKSLEFKVSVSSDLPDFFLFDEFRLEQILLNLLSNARKFTDSGFVSISIDKKLVRNKEFILFAVKDSGIGITREDLDILFDRFTQADSGSTKKYEGTGLGLAIVKQLVELMDGEITVESNIGKGSLFNVLIPLKQSNSIEIKDNDSLENQPESLSPGSSSSVLLVDDVKENRFLVKMFLQSLPVSIVEASNGLEAVEAFKNGSFDVVLMDIQMPQMDGLEATTTIRQYEKENSLLPVPIIALSAYVQEKEVRESKVVGCNQHIAKPVQREVLTSIVISSINQYKQAAKK